MAHMIDQTSREAGAAFSVGQSMWHRLGRVLPKAPETVEQALAAAGINWQVEHGPVYQMVQQPTLDGADSFDKAMPIDGYKVLVRNDTGSPLAVVGEKYTPLQNREAFEILQPLIDGGLATWETGGALREGRDVWGLVKFDVTDPVVQEGFGSEVQPYGLITNNHSGQRCVRLLDTPIRVVCWNTLSIAVRDGQRSLHAIRHTANVAARVVEAAQGLWGEIVERNRIAARQYQLLRATFLDTAIFNRLVLESALPYPEQRKHGKEADRRHNRRCEKIEARRARVRLLWDGGIGHVGDRSAWEAYNALTQAVDHDERAFPTRRESRAEADLFGDFGKRKQAVLVNLLQHGAGDRYPELLTVA